jgi:predicted RNA-binding protein with RPS1 domain
MFEDRDEEEDFEYHHSKIQKKENSNESQNFPPLYSIHYGEVVSIKDFGAFIRLDSKVEVNERHNRDQDRRRDTERHRAPQGLLHISEISKLRVENIREVLSVGEKVWVKVIKIADGKMSLSMRVVSQRDGTDIDPNNVELMLTEQKRKPFDPDKKKEKYQLEAILPTVCEKCKSVGHASWECWNSNQNSKYELIKEDDPILQTQKLDNIVGSNSHHHHHHGGNHEKGDHHTKEGKKSVLEIKEITSTEQALDVLNYLNRLSDEKKHKKHKKEKQKHKHKKKDKKDKEKRKRKSEDSTRYNSDRRERRQSDRDLPIRKSYRYLDSP